MAPRAVLGASSSPIGSILSLPLPPFLCLSVLVSKILSLPFFSTAQSLALSLPCAYPHLHIGSNPQTYSCYPSQEVFVDVFVGSFIKGPAGRDLGRQQWRYLSHLHVNGVFSSVTKVTSRTLITGCSHLPWTFESNIEALSKYTQI